MIYIPYAGIGSRRTPHSVFKLLNNIGKKLDRHGLTLRSGGAIGADQEFERFVRRSKEIFRPTTFKGRLPHGHIIIHESTPYEKAYKIAEAHHPAWQYLQDWQRALHIRNVFQVLGADLESHSLFVLCYTLDSADGVKIKTTKKTGGTGTAIRVAATYGIPVINLNSKDGKSRLIDLLKNVGIVR